MAFGLALEFDNEGMVIKAAYGILKTTGIVPTEVYSFQRLEWTVDRYLGCRA
jgi:hypothetical protein